MIKDPTAKFNFSDKDKTVLLVNHNYYVRTAIATLADMFLTFIIIVIIAVVITGAGLLFVVGNEGSHENTRANTAVWTFVLVIDALLAIFYFFYVIVKIARVSKQRKHVNHIENQIIENCVVATKTEEPKAEEPKAEDLKAEK